MLALIVHSLVRCSVATYNTRAPTVVNVYTSDAAHTLAQT
jgi:hypothetical protein